MFLFLMIVAGIAVFVGVVNSTQRRANFNTPTFLIMTLVTMFTFPLVPVILVICCFREFVHGSMALVEWIIDSVSLGIANVSGHDPANPKPEDMKTLQSQRRNAGLMAYYFGRMGARAASWFGFSGALDNFDARHRPAGLAPLRKDDVRHEPHLRNHSFDNHHQQAERPAYPESAPRPAGTYPFQNEYHILERMPTGGSTAKLFKVQRLVNGRPEGDLLVLKYFDLTRGSDLEHIIRESASVQQAMRLGIVLDSQTLRECYYYVMPFYHGDPMTHAVMRLHRDIGAGETVPDHALDQVMVWSREIVAELHRYHHHGLFHKDIKPDNIIVSLNRAFLIDVGLITPLDSGLLLTTHGTEYYRDPEMVRMAIKGMKIKDADCAKFDIYSLGATLYFMLEGTFPASGSLSRYTKKVPYALQCIANKAMTDIDKRYASVEDMLRDLEEAVWLARKNGWNNVKVSELTSFGGACGYEYTPPATEFSTRYQPGAHLPRRGEEMGNFVPTAAAPAAAAYAYDHAHSVVSAEALRRRGLTPPPPLPVEPPAAANVVYRPARASSFFWGIAAALLLSLFLLPIGLFSARSIQANGDNSYPEPMPAAHSSASQAAHTTDPVATTTNTVVPAPVRLPDLNGMNHEVRKQLAEYRNALNTRVVNEGRFYDVHRIPVIVLPAATLPEEYRSAGLNLATQLQSFLKAHQVPVVEQELNPDQLAELQRLDADWRERGDAALDEALYPWLRSTFANGTLPYILWLDAAPIAESDRPLPEGAVRLTTRLHYEREDTVNTIDFTLATPEAAPKTEPSPQPVK